MKPDTLDPNLGGSGRHFFAKILRGEDWCSPSDNIYRGSFSTTKDSTLPPALTFVDKKVIHRGCNFGAEFKSKYWFEFPAKIVTTLYTPLLC